MKTTLSILYTMLGAACLAVSSYAADGAASGVMPLTVVARYPVGGTDTGYDFVRLDVEKRRVYVAHGTHVEVLDADSGARVDQIGGMHGVHDIVIVPGVGKGYTSDGTDRALTVFDRDSLHVLRRIRYTGIKPDAMEYSEEAQKLFVVNGGETGDLTVVDPKSDAIVGTVELGGSKLEQIGFDGRGHGFVNDESRNVVHVFSTADLRKLAEWPLAPCEEPTALAMDAPHHRAFAACGNGKLVVLDTDTGRHVAVLPIGEDPDGAAFDAATGRIFTASRTGTLSVIHAVSPDRYEALQTVTTEAGARTLAFDPRTGRIYLPTARMGPKAPGVERAPLLPETFVLLAVGAEH